MDMNDISANVYLIYFTFEDTWIKNMSETDRYKCPSCGGTMEFSPKKQKLECPFCGEEKSLEEYKEMADQKAANNVDIQAGAQKFDNPEAEEGAAAQYVCNSCGGMISPSYTSASTECPFCGAPIVLTDKIKGQQVPDLMIPFQVEKKAIKETYQNFVNKAKFVPSDFKSSAHIDSIESFYVPFWLYSCCTESELTIEGEVVTKFTSGKVETIEHKVYSIYRHVSMKFEDVPADGSKDMDDALMDSLEPFDVKSSVKYDSAYLSGFGAQLFDVSSDENYQRVKKRMEESVRSSVLQTLRNEYEDLTIKEENHKYSNNVIKYALFPVWLQKTSWNGKEFVFAMNGQTGKFVGSVPVDWTVASFWGLGSTVVLTVIFGLIYRAMTDPSVSAMQCWSISFIAAAIISAIAIFVIASGNNNVSAKTEAMMYSGDLNQVEPGSVAFVRAYKETRNRG